MKKIYTLLLASFLLVNITAKAQNILLFNDFQQPHYFHSDTLNSPSSTTSDSTWYFYNSSPVTHCTGSTIPYRPNHWFLSYPISKTDRYATGLLDTTNYTTFTTAPDSNTVLAASSWTNCLDVPAAMEANYCITPNVRIGSHDTLFWKSAPFQTPRYLDRYDVLLSHTNNDVSSFTDTLFRAAEMVGIPPGGGTDTVFADFTFSPQGPNIWVHGLNGMDMDNAGTTAPVSHRGRLHSFSVPLDAYINQNIFIAFLSNSHDDNGISIDDIMIRGTVDAGIKEVSNSISLAVFPNPANESAQLNFILSSETSVLISLFDIAGKLVYSENKGTMAQGRHFDNMNIASLAKGYYTINVQTNAGNSVVKLIVQ